MTDLFERLSAKSGLSQPKNVVQLMPQISPHGPSLHRTDANIIPDTLPTVSEFETQTFSAKTRPDVQNNSPAAPATVQYHEHYNDTHIIQPESKNATLLTVDTPAKPRPVQDVTHTNTKQDTRDSKTGEPTPSTSHVLTPAQPANTEPPLQPKKMTPLEPVIKTHTTERLTEHISRASRQRARKTTDRPLPPPKAVMPTPVKISIGSIQVTAPQGAASTSTAPITAPTPHRNISNIKDYLGWKAR